MGAAGLPQNAGIHDSPTFLQTEPGAGPVRERLRQFENSAPSSLGRSIDRRYLDAVPAETDGEPVLPGGGRRSSVTRYPPRTRSVLRTTQLESVCTWRAPQTPRTAMAVARSGVSVAHEANIGRAAAAARDQALRNVRGR